MRLTEPQAAVLSALTASFPPAWKVTVSGSDVPIDAAHPLFGEIEALANGRVSTLPVTRGAITHWVTFGGSHAALRDAIDTLRAWLIPAHASEEANPIVSPANASGALASTLLSVSSHGYYRWRSPSTQVDRIARKFVQMRVLERRRPHRPNDRHPSLLELRAEFQAAYATADWAAAERAIEQIDALQLDSALNSAQMRIRLWVGLAEYERAIHLAESTGLLYLNITDRIRQLLLEAYAARDLSLLEAQGLWGEAAERYRQHLHPRLAGAIAALRERSSTPLQHLFAYRAWVDQDQEALLDPQLPPDDALVKFLRSGLATPAPTSPAEPAHIPASRWADLVSLMLQERDDLVGDFLERNCTLSQLREIGQADACSDALLHLYTDIEISNHTAARRSRQRVLMRVIETALCDAAFPLADLEKLYQDVLDLWLMEHGDSSFPAYGQLVLSVAEGLLALSARHEAGVLRCVREWWSRRPTHARLAWLLEAIDLLSLHAAHSDGIDALWLSGMALIQRDRTTIPATERRLWRQLASRLAIPDATIEAFFAGEPPDSPSEDLLAAINLKRIAIVTLQERAGRMAADMLAARTHAEIILINSTVADSGTRAASEADLILFVWAASKHAVLRAFDGVRQKLEYVQGTGPASIVLAAERWAAAHSAR
jgi:hypothetical protein